MDVVFYGSFVIDISCKFKSLTSFTPVGDSASLSALTWDFAAFLNFYKPSIDGGGDSKLLLFGAKNSPG